MILAPLPDETELLARLQEGDSVAFTRLYRHYWKAMLLVAWNHTKDKDLAEDIVHEVFMMLWEKRTSRQIGSVGGFLATAVKFRVIRYYQRERHRQQLVDRHLDPIEELDGESELDALFLREYLAGIVERLPEKCRLVFQLSRDQGLKNREIAEIMKISEKGVEANLTRALKLIRRSIKENGLVLLMGPAALGKLTLFTTPSFSSLSFY